MASSEKPATAQERAHLASLLRRQEKHMPQILQVLEKNGRKTSHWAWWVRHTPQPAAPAPPSRAHTHSHTHIRAGSIFIVS